MSYVTSIGALTLTPMKPSTTTSTKIGPVPAKAPPSPASTAHLTVTGRLQPRPATPPAPGAVVAPDGTVTLPSDSTRTLLIAGGAVTVGLLLVIALRR